MQERSQSIIIIIILFVESVWYLFSGLFPVSVLFSPGVVFGTCIISVPLNIFEIIMIDIITSGRFCPLIWLLCCRWPHVEYTLPLWQNKISWHVRSCPWLGSFASNVFEVSSYKIFEVDDFAFYFWGHRLCQRLTETFATKAMVIGGFPCMGFSWATVWYLLVPICNFTCNCKW